MNLILSIAIGSTFFLLLAFLIAPALLRPSRAARRMMEVIKSNREDVRTVSRKEHHHDNVLALAQG